MAAVSEVERVERGRLLVRGNCIRVGGRGRAGGVHGILLRNTRERRNDDSGHFRPLEMDGELVTARPFPDQGRERRNQRGARERLHPATGKEVFVVGDVEENGRCG